MPAALRVTLLALFVTGSAVTGAVLWGYYLTRAAEPAYQGERGLPGLSAPVTVHFGPRGVPTLRGATVADVVTAQGYLTAAERMWQMDLLRRLARGRLAEVLGEEALVADRLFLTLGLGAAAAVGLAALPPDILALYQAYADGVNRYQATHRDRPPLEYRIAGFRPTPWSPLDTLAIGELMAAMNSYNYREELAFLRLAQRLGSARARELFPTDEGIPAPETPPLPDLGGITDPWRAYARFAAAHGLPVPGAASNNWALAGSRTVDGAPLLANDPHLASGMPGVWYAQELIAPGLQVSGVTIPGVPLVLIGHNPHLAWGLTTVGADTQDVYLERVTGDGRAVERAEAPPEPIATEVVSIPVKGRPDPERLTLRRTGNGVVLNDILGLDLDTGFEPPAVTTPYLLTLRWNSELAETAPEGLWRLNTATTVDQARAAARMFLHAAQNFVFAHRDGTIAWQMSGAIPRRAGGPGPAPRAGWLPGQQWTGYLPRDANPGLESPPQGYVATANSRTLTPDHPAQVTRTWMPPYRSQRIRELLATRERWDRDGMLALQMDQLSQEARVLLLALAREADTLRTDFPDAWPVARDLLQWDGTMAADSRQAAVFVALKRALYEALFADELGEADLEILMGVSLMAYNALQEVLYSGRSSFWDDVGTADRFESPTEVWARALRAADKAIPRGEAGHLGRLRRLVFPHAFHDVPVLGPLFDVGPVAVGGDDYTLNVVKAELDNPWEPRFIASCRVVFTPGGWGASRFTLPLGQSGHRFSPHRGDQLGAWLAGGAYPLPWNGPPPGTDTRVLTLHPATEDTP